MDNSIDSASKLIDKLEAVEPHEYDGFIASLLKTEKPITLGFLNQHAYNIASQDSQTLQAFSNVDYLLRDGIGIKLACRFRKINPGANLNGTDLIPALITKALASDLKVQFFVFGTESPWLEEGSRRLLRSHPYHGLHGFYDTDEYLQFANERMDEHALKIIVLAMGMPKQEKLAQRLRSSMKGAALIICGGAIIDFQAGRFKRAPVLFRKLGLEWFYRLLQEPKRLFSRYVFGIPKFFMYVLADR